MHYQRDVLDSLRRLVRALRASSRLAERDLGLSGAQLLVLQVLREEPSLSINELAERTHTHQSSVSTVVTRLVESKLVEKKASRVDARRFEVRLTARGKNLGTRAPTLAQEKLIAAIGRLPASDQATLANLLLEVNRLAGFDDQTPNLFFEDEASPGDSTR